MIADQYNAFLFDLDGVVYLDDQPVEGAVKTINRLRRNGKEVQFVTNSSAHTREAFASKLTNMGINVEPTDVTSAAWATAKYLCDYGIKTVYLIGSDGFRTELHRQDITIAEEAVDAVVIGFDTEVTYVDIERATRLVHNGNRPIIATSGDSSYPTADGIAPGTGAVVRAVETATATEAVIVGKPNSPLFELATENLSQSPVVMVGDTPDSDIEGAHRAGIDSILLSAHCRQSHHTKTKAVPNAIVSTPLDLFAADIE